MAVEWTEAWSEISLTNNGSDWVDYNLNTLLSVPKGAIAYIVLINNTNAAHTVGVRTDGSALDRYVNIWYGQTENSLVTALTMYAKVHSDTGIVEIYSDVKINAKNITAYLAGYWTGVDFTERFDSVTSTAGGGKWTAWDVYTSYSVPKGSVCSVTYANYDSASPHNIGIRINGSKTDYFSIAVSRTSTSANCGTFSVKSSFSTGKIDYYEDNTTNTKYYLTGYFSSAMDYQEVVWENATATVTTWQDWNTSSTAHNHGLAKGLVADVTCHSIRSAGTADTVGARAKGSALERKITPYSNYYRSGIILPTATDSSGLYQFITADTTYPRSTVLGFYVESADQDNGWYECCAPFMGTYSSWTDVDLYSLCRVPKGAVAFVVMQNANKAVDCYLGVRTNGSALERKAVLHEAEAGGGTHLGLYVKTDADGIIETIATSQAGGANASCNFFLMGYWVGVDFTEAWNDVGLPAKATTWGNISGTVQASVVHQMVCGNLQQDAATTLGIKSGGSGASTRYRSVHEAEGDSAKGGNWYSACTKADANGKVMLYSSSITSTPAVFYDAGYFAAANMDYVDENTPPTVSITSANVWTDYTYSNLDSGSRVVDCIVGHSSASAEYNVGVRQKGRATVRILLEHESETNNYAGFGIPAQADADKKLQFICGHASYEYMQVFGYYKPTYSDGAKSGWLQWVFTTEPPSGSGYKKIAYVAEPQTSSAWNKVKREGD